MTYDELLCQFVLPLQIDTEYLCIHTIHTVQGHSDTPELVLDKLG